MADCASEKRDAYPIAIEEAQAPIQHAQSRQASRKIAAFTLVVAALWFLSQNQTFPYKADPLVSLSEQDICPQVQPWKAPDGALPPSSPSPSKLASLISGAVQVNTSVYDDYPLPVSSSPQIWQETFGPMRDYLKKAFPLIHSSDKVKKEIINEHGLLYTWTGIDESLRPIVFMAHQGECSNSDL